MTFSTNVKDGSRRTEVGRSAARADFVERSGIGMLEAESMSRYYLVSFSRILDMHQVTFKHIPHCPA